ncbi:MAG TPA: peptidoglycan DD-metalloendopeptidase family protein [Tepidisphaeraceae bacterium]|jgi:Ca2+-binding RTX toxin-like protein|nr:peptidoglycan DD-metalloendopeptidase family protein [Tepidisphaeraceae bacterium]
MRFIRQAEIESLESRRLLTVLTFDPDGIDGNVLPVAYGDRVVAASQNNFDYGTAGGTTQNVTVGYGTAPGNVHQQRDGYGDLHNIVHADDSAGGLLDITLSADLGFQASVSSLDLVTALNTNQTIKAIQVYDGGSNLLFHQNNVAINTGTHAHISFPSLNSRVLRIRIDASNLGANGDQIGVDNIQFGQVSGASTVGDGYADVVEGFHDSGTGGIAGPYGGNTDNQGSAPVSLGVVLGGDADTNSYLSLPTGSNVVVGFSDETIVDGPGDDLAVKELVDTGEQANVYVSSNYKDFTFLGLAKAGRTNKFDLASIHYTDVVRAVKVEGLDANGGSPGFDLVNVQAEAGAMRSETYRYPIGDGVSVPGIAKAFGSGSGYLAQDFATPAGKSVFPFMWGTVGAVGSSSELGNYILVAHRLPDGTMLQSLYGHLSAVSVRVGDAVTTSTKLGLTGMSVQNPTGVLTFQIFQGETSQAIGLNSGTGFSSNNTSFSVGENVYTVFNPSNFIATSGPLSIGFENLSSGGGLSVAGTNNDDHLDLSAISGLLSISLNGITRAADLSTVKSITITLRAGDDRATIGSGIIGAYVDGGVGNDNLSGGDGKDTLTGGAGKNTLLGNGGDDRLNGSGSRDSISGGDGADRLYGNDGDDSLDGGTGVDRLFGGNGNDFLFGGSSNDKLYGEAGDDTLSGGNQNDSIDGGSGNDLLIGGDGIDTFHGNAGNDIISAFDHLADSIDGGSGTDQARIDNIDATTSVETVV